MARSELKAQSLVHEWLFRHVKPTLACLIETLEADKIITANSRCLWSILGEVESLCLTHGS